MAEKKTESLFLNRLEECKYPKADIGKEDVKVWSQTEFKGEDNYLESAFKHASKRKGKNGEGKPEFTIRDKNRDLIIVVECKQSNSQHSSCSNLEDFKNMDCIVGADLAKKIDLTSICFEFYKDGLYYFIHHSWIPRERYDIVMKEGKYRYDLWVDAGYLTLCEGANVDYEEILDFMEEVKFKYNIKIKEFCYDPWNASQFVNYIEKHYGYRCVEVRQGPQTLNEPTQDIRDLTYACKLRHPTDDGLMNFAMSNCIATQHKQEWIMLDKEKSKEKIDPIAAMVDAHCRAMKVLKNSTKSIFYVPNRKR